MKMTKMRTARIKTVRVSMMPNDIHAEFDKICAFLKLDGYELIIDPLYNEGFCNMTKKTILLGVERGYCRRLLIHECLHAIGYSHNGKNFSGHIGWDFVSPMYERWIFGATKDADYYV